MQARIQDYPKVAPESFKAMLALSAAPGQRAEAMSLLNPAAAPLANAIAI